MSAKNKLNGVKYLIASASLVTTIGLWNYFSSQTEINEQAQKKLEPDPQVSTIQQLEYPPLPTLVPGYQTQLSEVRPLQESYEASQNQIELREVQRPETQVQAAPQVTINQVILGQSGGNTLSNPPVNNTGSSK